MWYHWDCAFYRDTMYYRSSCSTNSGHCASGSDFLPARTPDGSKRAESWRSLHSWRKKFLQRRSWMSLHSWIESVIQKMNDNNRAVWSLYIDHLFYPLLDVLTNALTSRCSGTWNLEPYPYPSLLFYYYYYYWYYHYHSYPTLRTHQCVTFFVSNPQIIIRIRIPIPQVCASLYVRVCVLVRPNWTDYKYNNEPRTSSCVVDGGPRVLSLYSWYRLW